MDALIYEKPWHMNLHELPIPTLQKGEVLIRMESVGICGSDVHGFTGESGRRAPGMVMGHEIVGRIEEIYDDEVDLKRGQRVAVFNVLSEHAPTKEEGDPSFLNKRVVGVNLGIRGAMAEFLAVPAINAIPVSDSTPAEVSVLAEPVAVALHAFHRLQEKNIREDTLAIIGSGTIGLCSLLVAQSLGHQNIVLLDLIPEKLRRAQTFGGKIVHLEQQDTADKIQIKTEEALRKKPALVIDAVGTKSSFEQALSMVAEKGTILAIGNLVKQVDLPLQDLVSREISLVGTYGFDREAFEAAVKILPQFQDKLQTLIEGHCTLQETPSVMTALAKGDRQALKIVIDF